jgi:hypothetical protein
MRSTSGARALACAATLCALWPGSALGQDGNAAAAELFRKGLDDMMAGRFDTGCPALAESQQLDPRPGTLFTLAECENKAGRIVSAAKHYGDYLRMYATLTPELQEKQKGRELISAQQLAAMESKVPRLTLTLPPDTPPGTVVKRDGVVVEASTFGQAVPVDPGEHVITAELPGKPAHEVRRTIALSEQVRMVVELAPPAPLVAPPPPKPIPVEPADDGSTLRMAGLVAGGVGVAGLLVGAITGGLAMSANGTAKDNCDGTVCNQDGLDAIDRTKPLGNASTACFVIGGVGVAAGVLMFVLAPSAESEAAPASEGLALRPWVGDTDALGAVAGLEGAW